MRQHLPPVGADLKLWANDLRRWLGRTWDSLTYKEADAKAAAAKTYKSKISILCAKGSSVKKVTALKPKCPPGFKQKPTKK